MLAIVQKKVSNANEKKARVNGRSLLRFVVKICGKKTKQVMKKSSKVDEEKMS